MDTLNQLERDRCRKVVEFVKLWSRDWLTPSHLYLLEDIFSKIESGFTEFDQRPEPESIKPTAEEVERTQIIVLGLLPPAR